MDREKLVEELKRFYFSHGSGEDAQTALENLIADALLEADDNALVEVVVHYAD